MQAINRHVITRDIDWAYTVEGSAFLSGGDIIQGTNSSTGTYVINTAELPVCKATGAAGSQCNYYSVTPTQNAGSASNPITINAQRTNIYKIGLIDLAGKANTYFVDNFGFSTK